MAECAVRIETLRRDFVSRRGRSRTVALDAIDLTIPVGEMHGLLGPNGAGKTTLCKILSTILLPTSGNAVVAGYDVVRQTSDVRQRIGIVLGGDRGLYDRMTARANLELWGALYGLRGRALAARVEALLDRFGLAERAADRVQGYSRGMKQRLHLARGLIGGPDVVLLDEPTSGMDPVAAHEVRSLLTGLREQGRTVLLATHDMAEAEAVCDRVSLIDRGKLLATLQPRALSSWLPIRWRVDAADVSEDVAEELLPQLRRLPGVVDVRAARPAGLRVEITAADDAPAVIRRLLDAGLSKVSTSQPDLEEVYLQVLGGRGMRVGP
jgi:ABC-2 type transport system ATP-binding protein